MSMKPINIRILWRTAAALLAGCAALALLTWIGVAFDFSHPATGALLYMIVIVLLSMTGNIATGIGLAIIATLCLNYFFTEPRFSFQVNAVEDIRDWARMDALHRPWMNALHPDDRSMDDWSAALAPGMPFEKEARLRQSDGEYRRFLLRFVPLRDERGSIVEWYAASTDIEDLRRAEEELRRREAHLRDAQMELAHANRVTTTGQLAASIAHEVSQPISAALTNANAARRWLGAAPPDLEEVGRALGRIIRDGRRASDIIGRIRALVRRAPPQNDQLDINETMLEVIALTRSELRSNGTSLRTRLAHGLPLVPGDRIQLQQVMLNLILNAIEAMSGSSEAARELLIRTELDGPGGVLVAVEDSGPGLKPQSLDGPFDAFYTTQPGGMGMGLSICRSIIEAHGGRVWATPNLPHGAAFQFTLPQKRETAS